jgi:hypothetical protein
MAPSGPGPYATGLMGTLGGFPNPPAMKLVGQSPPSFHAMTGRWPLSLLAGTRARTLAALAYAASEPSLPRPHAELAISQEISLPADCGALTSCTPQTDGPLMASSSACGRTGTPRRDVQRCSASFASGCQPLSESITDAHSASKDGRSRRGVPGASPQKPSAALPPILAASFLDPAS